MKGWIDFHSHILPGIDDGSRDVQESLEMLRLLSGQGVTTVAATSHFYPYEEKLDSFLANRQRAYERLKPELTDALPDVRLGAEVYYYAGISRMEGLSKLCLEGTDLLLLEMPMAEWGEYTIRELIDMNTSSGVTLMMAHIERFLKLQKKDTLERLLDNNILIQVNASLFGSMLNRAKAIRMLERCAIHAIGSDCHNLSTRKPNMDVAIQAITKKCGTEFADSFVDFTHSLLDER